MTSSCSLFGVGTHVVGPLQDFGWGLGKTPVWLGNGHFFDYSKDLLGSSPKSSHFSLMGQFMQEKRPFSTESEHFLRFFGLFLTSDEPGLRRTGLNLDLGEGVSLHVIESTSFSSPTGLPELPRAPGDLPGGLPRSFGKLCFFLKFFAMRGRLADNLLAVPRGRFAGAGDGSLPLTVY